MKSTARLWPCRQGRRQQPRQQWQDTTRRYMAVYAMGDSWTGAMGTGKFDQSIPGHDDTTTDTNALIQVHNGKVTCMAAGWGHSALIDTDGKNQQLWISGRPHDFSTILRLYRLPAWLREYAIQRTIESAHAPNGENISLMDNLFSWMMGGTENDNETNDENESKAISILPDWTKVDTEGIVSKSVHASAALTAILSQDGSLYTFGLNHHGQCGTGIRRNNVWKPQPVMGLNSSLALEGRKEMTQEHPIVQVALGLQHGLALNDQGHLFSWGKGERGQLGLNDLDPVTCSIAYGRPIDDFRMFRDGVRHQLDTPRITKISAGNNHSAVVTSDNDVFVWGKNQTKPRADDAKGKKIVDSLFPLAVEGLPMDLQVLDVSCGSHHTAMLLEDGSIWAVGIATDNMQPIFEAVEIVPPGIIEMPCRQFKAHFDRTTVVGKDGNQVLQTCLWSTEELREQAFFTPAWMDHFHDKKIDSVHRGWLHTLVAAEDY